MYNNVQYNIQYLKLKSIFHIHTFVCLESSCVLSGIMYSDSQPVIVAK